MKSSEQIDALAKALVKAQAEMPPVSKTATNPHYRSKYAPLDAVVKAAQPILAKNGLAIVQGGRESSNGKVVIVSRIVHESGQWVESELEMNPHKNDPQGVGACLTYGSRYGYRMVGVVTDEDDDANSASQLPGTQPVALTQAQSVNLAAKLKKEMGVMGNLDALREYYENHADDMAKLWDIHKQEVTELKDSMKADFENVAREG